MLGAYARKTPPTLRCAGCLVSFGYPAPSLSNHPQSEEPPSRTSRGVRAPQGVLRLRAWAERPGRPQLVSWRLSISHKTTPTIVSTAIVARKPKPRPELSSGSCSKCPFIALFLFLAMSSPQSSSRNLLKEPAKLFLRRYYPDQVQRSPDLAIESQPETQLS